MADLEAGSEISERTEAKTEEITHGLEFGIRRVTDLENISDRTDTLRPGETVRVLAPIYEGANFWRVIVFQGTPNNGYKTLIVTEQSLLRLAQEERHGAPLSGSRKRGIRTLMEIDPASDPDGKRFRQLRATDTPDRRFDICSEVHRDAQRTMLVAPDREATKRMLHEL